MNKAKIWQTAVDKHQTVIDDLDKRVREMESSVADVGESTYDHATLAQKSATYEVADTIKAQLEFAKEEMDLMNTIDTGSTYETVQLGAVIETDKRNFYLSVSIEDMVVDGTDIFGLSTKTPLGKAMLGKSKGDTFSFKETEYKILNVY